jgi:arginase family enzyme
MVMGNRPIRVIGAAMGRGAGEPGGIRARDLLPELAALSREIGLTAAEIVEYNPERDRDARTAQLVGTAALAILGCHGVHQSEERRELLAA